MTAQPEIPVQVEETVAVAAPRPGRLPIVLMVVIVAAALAAAVAIGYTWGAGGAAPATPSTSSVDAGFVRDMSTHHTQAITMAGYERDYTSNPTLKILAFDIETSQEFQLGQMQGWLDSWNLPRESAAAQMAWMRGHSHLQGDGLMPGMASPAQMDKLESLHGKALDVFFLQLMIRHHQGALPMTQYAQAHAGQQQVRDLAGAMRSVQTNEIVQMESLLRQLGGAPLPPPAG